MAKRLQLIQKKSRRDEQEAIKVDVALQKMEAAALESYRKDVESNADLTSMMINKKVKEDNLSVVLGEGKKMWREAKSKEGHIYYWNILSNGKKY